MLGEPPRHAARLAGAALLALALAVGGCDTAAKTAQDLLDAVTTPDAGSTPDSTTTTPDSQEDTSATPDGQEDTSTTPDGQEDTSTTADAGDDASPTPDAGPDAETADAGPDTEEDTGSDAGGGDATMANTKTVTVTAINALTKVAVPDVEIRVGGIVVGKTDDQGALDVTIAEGEVAALQAALDSFAPGFLHLTYDALPDEITVPVFPADAVQTVDATAGAIVPLLKDGVELGQIDIPMGGLVDQLGNAVTGDVDVRTTFVGPANLTPSSAPAPMVGIMSDTGEETPLESHAMVDVTITQAGNKLQVAAGAEITVTAPAAPGAPDSAPLWSVDVDTGTWKEEGTAILDEAGQWVMKLPHLSWWNVDTHRYGSCCVQYETKFPNGEAAPGVDLYLAFPAGGYQLLTTNANGTKTTSNMQCGDVFDVWQRAIEAVQNPDTGALEHKEISHLLASGVEVVEGATCPTVTLTALCRDDGDCPSGSACSQGTCGPVGCGDGMVDASAGEQCDDGNADSGDGCDAFCQTEVCGDGVISANEGCDDGNTAPDDGCSPTCQVEPGWSCQNAVNLNTGSDGKGGQLAKGAQDPRWQWSDSKDGPWDQDVYVQDQCIPKWHAAPAYAQWVNAVAGTCFSPDEKTTYYRTTFYIPEGQDGGNEGYAIVRMNGIYERVTFAYDAAEFYVNFLFGFGSDATTDLDGDGTPDVCDTDLSDDVGCADGTREGFADTSAYPDIAACAGGWSVPGLVLLDDNGTPTGSSDDTLSDQIDHCGNGSGNDSGNPSGQGCSVEDLCAVGWSVCADQATVAAKAGGEMACTNLGTTVAAPYLFATRQRSQGSYICDISLDPKGTNDVYGCGSADFGKALSNCGPLNRVTDDNCAAVEVNTDWACNDNDPSTTGSFRELADVTKSSASHGGVLCCRN